MPARRDVVAVGPGTDQPDAVGHALLLERVQESRSHALPTLLRSDVDRVQVDDLTSADGVGEAEGAGVLLSWACPIPASTSVAAARVSAGRRLLAPVFSVILQAEGLIEGSIACQ